MKEAKARHLTTDCHTSEEKGGGSYGLGDLDFLFRIRFNSFDPFPLVPHSVAINCFGLNRIDLRVQCAVLTISPEPSRETFDVLFVLHEYVVNLNPKQSTYTKYFPESVDIAH